LGALIVDSLSFQATGSLNNIAISGADSSFSGKSLIVIDSVDSVIDFPDGKLQAADVSLAQNQILIGDANGIARAKPVSNDLSVNAEGQFTIAADAVTSAKIDDETITSADIEDGSIAGVDLDSELIGIDIDGGNIDGVVIGSVTPEEATFSTTHLINNLGVGLPANAGFPSSWGTKETGRVHAEDLLLTNQLGVGSTGSKARFHVNEWGKIIAKKIDLTNSAEETFYKLGNTIEGSRKDSIIDLRSLNGYASLDFSGTFDTGTDYQGRIGVEPGLDYITIRSENSSIGLDMSEKRVVKVGDPVNSNDAINLGYITDGTKNLIIKRLITEGSITAKDTVSTINKVIRVRNAANSATMAEMRTDGMIWGKDLHITNASGQSYLYTTYDGSNGILEVKGPNQAWIDIGRHENDFIGRFVAKQNETFPTIMSGHSTIALDVDNKRLTGVSSPNGGNDAANKDYVDANSPKHYYADGKDNINIILPNDWLVVRFIVTIFEGGARQYRILGSFKRDSTNSPISAEWNSIHGFRKPDFTTDLDFLWGNFYPQSHWTNLIGNIYEIKYDNSNSIFSFRFDLDYNERNLVYSFHEIRYYISDFLN
jgi:hypothetical protein